MSNSVAAVSSVSCAVAFEGGWYVCRSADGFSARGEFPEDAVYDCATKRWQALTSTPAGFTHPDLLGWYRNAQASAGRG